MAKLWLPIKEQTTGREMIIIIPGASQMDQGQLKEIIAWQTEKTTAQLKAMGPKPVARYPRKEVGKAIKEYREWLRKKEL